MKIILKFLLILLVMWSVCAQSQQAPDNPKTTERAENVVTQYPKQETKKQAKISSPSSIMEREYVEQKDATTTNKKENEKKSEFTNRLTTDPIYLLTSFLVFATFGLWYATYRLVTGAKKTASQQLRAYVFVSLADGEKLFFDNKSGCLSAPLIIKNYGQTPAYKLKCSVFINLYKLPLSEVLDPPDYTNGSLGCVAPTQIFRLYSTLPRKLTQLEMNTIKTGEGGIYIWGYLEYIDIFKIYRKTQFQMLSTGADFERGELAYCIKGNEAT